MLVLMACLSLGLGLGASTALFSIYHQLVRKSLPVPQPEQLVNLAAPGPKTGAVACDASGGCDEVFSYPLFRDLQRDPASPLVSLAAFRHFDTNVALADRSLSVAAMHVSGTYFPTLGLRAHLGRLITSSDETGVDPFVAVVSHGFWIAQMGADSGAIGRRMTVAGQQVTVVGVAPREFRGTTLALNTAVFVPITLLTDPSMRARLDTRTNHYFYLFGRVRDGMTIAAATEAINAIFRPINANVDLPLQSFATDASRDQFLARRILLSPGARGQSVLQKNANAPLRVLLGLTGLLLLIAGTNVANLLLVRATARGREIAVRIALGGTAAQVSLTLVIEAVMLVFLGSVIASLLAFLGVAWLRRLLPTGIATSLTPTIDAPVALFLAVGAMLMGCLIASAPVLLALKADIRSMLGGAARAGETRSTARARRVLVTTQISLAVALLLFAGLFVRSLRNIGSIQLGLDPAGVVTFQLSPGQSGYDTTRSRRIYSDIEDQLAQLPGIDAASASLVPLFARANWISAVVVEGYTPAPDEMVSTRFDRVGDDYFDVLGMSIVAGRTFGPVDATGPKVAVVNESFVRRFRLGTGAIGRRFGMQEQGAADIEIVGVVRDGKYGDVKGDIPPMVFTPWRAGRVAPSMLFSVRSGAPLATVSAAIERKVKEVDAALPVRDLATLVRRIDENIFTDRALGTLSALFAALATILAAVGLYGLLAYTVMQQTREIGVRMALGANARRISGFVLRQTLPVVATGLLVGLGLGLSGGRVAQSLLFEIQPFDASAIAGSTLLVLAVVFLASYVPARRACRVEPMEALRQD